MKQNKQLIVDLNAVKLNTKDLARLHKSLHNFMAKAAKKSRPKTAANNVAGNFRDISPAAAVEATGKTATLEVVFRNVDPGLSNFTASHNDDNKTIHQSDDIIFEDVKADDTILIMGDTAGSTSVKISGVNAIPMEMNFVEGQHINGLFFIIK